MHSLEDSDGWVYRTGAERSTFQARLDKWQHMLRLCTRVRIHCLLGKDLLGTVPDMMITFRRLRLDCRQGMPIDDEWVEMGRMTAMEGLRFFNVPAVFDRFMRFEMEPETPGRFSLMDFFATTSTAVGNGTAGGGEWKLEFGRALESFVWALRIFFGLPNLATGEAFVNLRTVLEHDTVADGSDAYPFYVVNNAICRGLRRFRRDVPSDAEGPEGLRGGENFRRVMDESFVAAMALIPDTGSELQAAKLFLDKGYKDLDWGRGTKEGDDRGGKRARATAEAEARKLAKASAADVAAAKAAKAPAGPRPLCAFHLLGLLGVADVSAAGGGASFVCRAGAACKAGEHPATLRLVTKGEATRTIAGMKGLALVEKGKAAIAGKTTQAFRP